MALSKVRLPTGVKSNGHYVDQPLGLNGKPIGYTRVHTVSRVLQQREHPRDTWRTAIRHRDIRQELLDIADGHGAHSYTYRQARGGDPTDRKSFVPKDKDYGSSRTHRPPILFHFDGSTLSSSSESTGVMMYNSQVVLDQDDHEIRLFTGIPDVLSSLIEGWEVEYFKRQFLKLTYADLVARTPPNTVDPKALSMRASRFRWQAGILSCKPRDGSAALKEYLERLINPVGNSVQNFGRDLSNTEVEASKAANSNKYPHRRRKEKREAEARAQATDKGDNPNQNTLAHTANTTTIPARKKKKSTTISSTLSTPSLDDLTSSDELEDISSSEEEDLSEEQEDSSEESGAYQHQTKRSKIADTSSTSSSMPAKIKATARNSRYKEVSSQRSAQVSHDEYDEDDDEDTPRRTSLRSKSDIHLPSRYRDDDISSSSRQQSVNDTSISASPNTRGSQHVHADTVFSRRQTKRKRQQADILDKESSDERGFDTSGSEGDDEVEDPPHNRPRKRSRTGQKAVIRPSYGGKTFPTIMIGGKSYPPHMLGGKTLPPQSFSQPSTALQSISPAPESPSPTYTLGSPFQSSLDERVSEFEWRRFPSGPAPNEWESLILESIPVDARSFKGTQIVNSYLRPADGNDDREAKAKAAMIKKPELDGSFWRKVPTMDLE